MFTFTVRDFHGSLYTTYEMSLDHQPTNEQIVLPRFMGHFVDEAYSRRESNEVTDKSNNQSALVHSNLPNGTLLMIDKEYLQSSEGKTDFQGIIDPHFFQ
jgi:hypothetical protein